MRFSVTTLIVVSLLHWTLPATIAQELGQQSAMRDRIDSLVDAGLREVGWDPAGECSDASFVRRAFLDLTGAPPTASEALDFIEDASPDKRDVLVSQLLTTPAHALHLASTWADWLLPELNGPQIGQGPNGLQLWLRNRFAENLRYDRLVADLLVASGSSEAGPTAFFVALEAKPEKIAARTARVFMGVQLDCAQCHDHPFDDWKQRDFWGLAAYFAQLSTGGDPAMMARGQIVDVNEGDVTLPGSDEVIPPKPLVKSDLSGLGTGTRRQQLTLWLTTRENPFLARATVNRVWSLLMGRGLIEPVDDMRSLEIASHPELLAELSDYFTDSGYDLRNLIQTIASTQAYRRATTHLSGVPSEDRYAVMATKPLTERQLAASLAKVGRAIAGLENGSQSALEGQLGKLRGDASEAKLGIVSALVTLHGTEFDSVSQEDASRLLKALEAPHLDERRQMQWLFLSVLNRLPTQTESAQLSKVIHRAATSPQDSIAADDGSVQSKDDVQGANIEQDKQLKLESKEAGSYWKSDLLWAMLNSSEFAMTP